MTRWLLVSAPALVLVCACGGNASGPQDASGDAALDVEPEIDDPGTDEPADPAAEDLLEEEPECVVDGDCAEDEACGDEGGCDGDPCRDDRCVSGECAWVEFEECRPGFHIDYRYRACCPWRILVVEPDGTCTFEVEGEPAGARSCEETIASYITTLVEQAGELGFFGWGEERCVPSPLGADFSLTIGDGEQENTIACTGDVCVGNLCDIIDGIWALLPSGWHGGCGC